jgi:GR25 family glycosyltransferase involved in LPS biosynthesis
MDSIECVYYINLDHRTDRKQQFEEEMTKLGIPESKRVRIPAIYNKDFGILGCGLSHKKALETFLASSHTNCLIFEDDFQFTLDMNYVRYLLKVIHEEKVPYDLVMLAGNLFKTEATQWPFLQKVLDGQTASGFLITRSFAPKLLQALEESTTLLQEWHKHTGEKKHEYCNDIYWKKLQPKSNWYVVHPKTGIQRESYSDNEYKVTSYGV